MDQPQRGAIIVECRVPPNIPASAVRRACGVGRTARDKPDAGGFR